MIGRLWRRRSLVLTLVRRQYQLRYRQSFIGLAWAFIPPLATLGAATLVFGEVIGVDTGKTPYAIFAFAALVPWAFFANSLIFGVPSIVNADSMVRRLAFPRAALPLSSVGAAVLDLVIAAGIFVILAYWTGLGIPATAVLFPVILLIETVFIVGIVLLGSALNVFARDVRVAVPLVTQVWLLVTPVMYPLDSVPAGLRFWFQLNPMTGVVEMSRRVIVDGRLPDAGLLLGTLFGAVAVLLLGYWYFSATERRFTDVI